MSPFCKIHERARAIIAPWKRRFQGTKYAIIAPDVIFEVHNERVRTIPSPWKRRFQGAKYAIIAPYVIFEVHNPFKLSF
jgi:hypothetical protein